MQAMSSRLDASGLRILNDHGGLSSQWIKWRQMVTLAYIYSYILLSPSYTMRLANSTAQKYYCCVNSGDNTCCLNASGDIE